MYAHADEIERYLNDGSPAHTDGPKKPYISCEYMHAMGNSCGNMDEYTALERYPMYQGGFIWDFIDQAIGTKLPDGTTRMSTAAISAIVQAITNSPATACCSPTAPPRRKRRKSSSCMRT